MSKIILASQLVCLLWEINLIAIMMLTSNKDFERSNKVKVGYYIGVQSLFSAPIFHPLNFG